MKCLKSYEWLMDSAKIGKLSHAYIFEGKTGGIKADLAFQFAHAITSHSEDIHHTKADGRSVKDQAVLSLQERLSTKPMIGDRTVAVIEDADTMTQRAQNRLLKTLEEPAGGAVIILLSENTENLLPTVISRCVIVRTDRATVRDAIKTDSEAKAARVGAMLLEGRGFYGCLSILNEISKEREKVQEFLDATAIWIRYSALDTIGPDKALHWIGLVEEAGRGLRRGFNAAYLLKCMLIKMII